MATINFYSSSDDPSLQIDHSSGGSGIGLYSSAGFGSAVAVGEYNSTTFITNSAGTIQGAQLDTVRFINSSSCAINGGGTILLTQAPNYLSTVNIRFTHSTAVQCQNAKLRIYDRDNISNGASGVTTKVASISHLSTLQSDNTGSGNSTWVTPVGSSVIHTLLPVSPALSGTAPNGAGSTGTRHDWYLALSASPTSVGSKTSYSMYCELEYL